MLRRSVSILEQSIFQLVYHKVYQYRPHLSHEDSQMSAKAAPLPISKGSSIRANVLVSTNDPEVKVKLKITLRQGKNRLARIRHSDV